MVLLELTRANTQETRSYQWISKEVSLDVVSRKPMGIWWFHYLLSELWRVAPVLWSSVFCSGVEKLLARWLLIVSLVKICNTPRKYASHNRGCTMYSSKEVIIQSKTLLSVSSVSSVWHKGHVCQPGHVLKYGPLSVTLCLSIFVGGRRNKGRVFLIKLSLPLPSSDGGIWLPWRRIMAKSFLDIRQPNSGKDGQVHCLHWIFLTCR